MSLVNKAKFFATSAHNSIHHRRKYTDEPYWVHCERVAAKVATVTTDLEIISAAWLHDVLEDVAPTNPDFNADAIKREFGERVLTLVLEVTDVATPDQGNRATRKAINRAHLAAASKDAKLIKLADLIDNYIDISKHDPGFARIFKQEALQDLPYLKEGNAQLYAELKELLTTHSSK